MAIKKKTKWLKTLINQYKPDMIHIQETKCASDQYTWSSFRSLGTLLGISTSGSASAGLVTILPKGSVLTDIATNVVVDSSGRFAIMKLETTLEIIHVANIYMPADSKAARENFSRTLDNKYNLSQIQPLMVVGDWNFVEEDIDKVSSVNPEAVPHPVTQELLDSAELVDIFRYCNPDEQVVTFRHTSAEYRARLDRFYVSTDLLEDLSPLPTLASALAMSDHDPIGLQYKQPFQRDKPKDTYYRMSHALIQQLADESSSFRSFVDQEVEYLYDYIRVQKPSEFNILLQWDELKNTIRLEAQARDKKVRATRKEIEKRATELLQFSADSALSQADQLEAKLAAETELKSMQTKYYHNKQLRSNFSWMRDAETSSKLFFKQVKVQQASSYTPNLIYNIYNCQTNKNGD